MALVAGCGGGENPSSTSEAPGGLAGSNQGPTYAWASISTLEDTASTPVAPWVLDPNPADRHSINLVTQPSRGTASVVSGRLVYVPDPHFSGLDAFFFRATDAGGLSIEGVAQVVVRAVNDAPVATESSRAIFAGAAGTAVPWVEDSDAADAWTFQLVAPPAAGTAAFSGNRWTYSPYAGSAGSTDGFSYSVTDSAGATTTGTARVRTYDEAALGECTRSSTVNADGTLGPRTKSNACTFYGVTQTRKTSAGLPVSMDHFTNHPSNGAPPKAAVVLIGGGDLNVNLSGNAATGQASPNGAGNYVIRTAQLLADAGYLTVAIDRPSDQPAAHPLGPVASVDRYRLSVAHAVDILQVLRRIDTENLHLFLVGTSRGAFSAVAQNALAAGVSLSSPVTSDPTGLYTYLGDPAAPSLSAQAVLRPVHLLWHATDLCALSNPAGSSAYRDALVSAGKAVAHDVASGGVRVTAPGPTVGPDVCGPFDFHGFMGIEPAATAHVADWLNLRMNALGTNRRPAARFATVSAELTSGKQINLATLASDPDGDPLTYSVLHGTSALGGTVTLRGATAVYVPPTGSDGKTDYIVYVATDGRGGVGAGVIEIRVGWQ